MTFQILFEAHLLVSVGAFHAGKVLSTIRYLNNNGKLSYSGLFSLPECLDVSNSIVCTKPCLQ